MTIKDNKFVIITKSKTIRCHLPKDANNILKHEINFIIKQNELLAEHTTKIRLVNYCPNIFMETIFMKTENSETNEPKKFVLNFSQGLDCHKAQINVLPLKTYQFIAFRKR